MVSIRLASGTCEEGKTWYVCQANGFTGCCSVDACDLSTCPDETSPSSSASTTSSSSVVTKTLLVTTFVAPTSAATSTSSPLASTLSTSILAATSSFKSPGMVGVATASISSAPSSSSASIPSQTSIPAKGSNNVPIIAGVISGVVVFSMILALVWFCLRRRRRNNDQSDSMERYGVPNKDFVLDRSNSPNYRQLNISDSVFEPFGGRYKTPSPNNPNRLRTPVEDKPIPDIEKGTKLIPPPISTHPAYHVLRNSSPEHHPGTEIPVPNIPSPSQSPIPFGNSTIETTTKPPKSYSPPLPSPPMTQHPAYHISQLSHHPVFRSGPGSQPPSPPLPRRSSPPREIPIPRLNTSTINPARSTSLQPSQDPISPVAGHSELEAEVPVEYHSPPPLQTPISAISGAWFAASGSGSRSSAPEPKSKQTLSSQKKQSEGKIQTHTRSDTTYSIPIGLGLQSPQSKSKTRSILKRSSQTKMKSQPINHSHSTSELSSPSPTATVSGTLATSKPHTHIMSWAENLSFHHLPPPSSRSFNTIEIPTSTEKEVVSPVQEEPDNIVQTRTTTPGSFIAERWSGAASQTQRSSAATSVGVESVDTVKPPTSRLQGVSRLQVPPTNSQTQQKKEQQQQQQLTIPPNFFFNTSPNPNPSLNFKNNGKGKEREIYPEQQYPQFDMNTSGLTPATPKTAGSDGYGEGANTWGSWVDR